MIKKEIIDQVREQSDIVQIISEYLPLKKAGKYFRTLCPFHSEKSPSFYVSPDRQIYHCFGCGAGGSVYTFLMQYEKLPFPEAIRKLASKVGITIEEDKTYSKNQPLYDVCDFAAKFYAANLQNSKLATEYLKHRLVSTDTIKRFSIGYAPSNNLLYNAALKKGINQELLVKTGLIVKKADRYHDWFFNRITFPVYSVSGKIVGFGARALDSTTEPKYINTPETFIFKKGENLYGFFQAKNYLYQNVPILVEGNFDLLSLVNQGINNVVAPLGTALTNEHALLLRRYSNQVVIIFDPDSAGKAATSKTIETFLKVNIDPRIVMLPDGYDPDKFINTFGKEKFIKIVNSNIDFIDFILKMNPSDSVIEKRMRLKEIINLISLIQESINQELYINKTSEYFKISKDSLLKQIKQDNKSNDDKLNIYKKNILPSIISIEEQLLSLVISVKEYANIAKEELSIECFNDSLIKEILHIVYENIASNNLSSAKIIDLIENPVLKQKIADLSFRLTTIPTKKEFLRKIKMFKASWYYNAMLKARAEGDMNLYKNLSAQHYNLKKSLAKGVTNNEK